ncbi:MAG: CRISPR-associated endonuclease Cas1 [Dehalococcoidia bacterium]|nr:CRISPR-associated endonuclease Cas1 [Dehalococcoidia bacterium]
MNPTDAQGNFTDPVIPAQARIQAPGTSVWGSVSAVTRVAGLLKGLRTTRDLLLPDFGWEGRVTRGATDLVNSCLNYGYGILYSHVQRAVLLAGLDPYAGFVHVDRAGKPSLVLDLTEEFRQMVVDRTIFGLLNRGVKVEAEEGRLVESSRRLLAEQVYARLDGEEPYEGKKHKLRTISLPMPGTSPRSCEARGRRISRLWGDGKRTYGRKSQPYLPAIITCTRYPQRYNGGGGEMMARNVVTRKKVTFSLNGGLLEQMKELLQAKPAWSSQNRFVEEALEEHIKKMRREILRREFAEASRDPLFLADINLVEGDFEQADAEASEVTA